MGYARAGAGGRTRPTRAGGAVSTTTRISGVSLLFCDLVGSTALTMEIGEAASDELRHHLFEALRRPIAVYGGREVKSQGDGLMVAFTRSPRRAVGCAVAMQRAVARLDAVASTSLAIRIGLAWGEATWEDDDFFGTPVIEAARLSAHAGPAEIVATDATVCASSWSAAIERLGNVSLKGFSETVPCSRIAWDAPAGDDSVVPVPPDLQLDGHPAWVGPHDVTAPALEAWERVIGGAGATTFVVGAPRTGRTRFAAELAASVLTAAERRPVTVLAGTRDRRSGEWAVTVALRRAVMWLPADEVARLVAVPGFCALVPSVAIRAGTTYPGTPVTPATIIDSLSVLAAIRPTLLVLDDLERCEQDELDSVATLVGASIPGLHIVGCARTFGAEDELAAQLIAKFEGTATVVRLGPLTIPDRSAMIAYADLGDDGVSDEIGALGEDAVGDIAEAIDVLASLGPGHDARSRRRALAGAFPYRGLVPLDVDDADVFFGRDDVLELLRARLREHRFVAVVGTSGSGKSSLLRAGLAGADGHGRITVVTPDAPDVERTMTAAMGRGDAVVVDQFEQLFVRGTADDAERLVRIIADGLTFSTTTWIAITVRSDFYARCADHPDLARLVSESSILVGRPGEAELGAIIVSTASAADLRLEPGLAEALLADLRDEPSPLPLLGHTMYELWRRRRDRAVATEEYRSIGGTRGSIARTAAAVYARQPDDARHLVDQVLLRMVAIIDDRAPTRSAVRLTTLDETFGPRARDVIEQLVSARLVVVDDDRAELAHEALLSEWPRLAALIDDDRDRLRAFAHLARSAQEWADDGRSTTLLYRGSRLDAGAAVAAAHTPVDARTRLRRRQSRTSRRRAARSATHQPAAPPAARRSIRRGSARRRRRGRRGHAAPRRRRGARRG